MTRYSPQVSADPVLDLYDCNYFILLLPCIFKNYAFNSLLLSKLDKILGDKDAVANIAVKSLKVAKKFYEDTLGLIQVGAEDEELIASEVEIPRSIYISRRMPGPTKPQP